MMAQRQEMSIPLQGCLFSYPLADNLLDDMGVITRLQGIFTRSEVRIGTILTNESLNKSF